jgi:hypothetical protein
LPIGGSRILLLLLVDLFVVGGVGMTIMADNKPLWPQLQIHDVPTDH